MNPTAWPDATPLGDAREHVRTEAQRRGTSCPCCSQRAQVYKRTINSRMARDLITAVRSIGEGKPFHLPTVLGYGGDAAKLAYWDLIEEDPTPRPDGGRAGWWQVTLLGDRFAHGHARVHRHAHVYDGRFLQLSGPLVPIEACLGKRFDLAALLAGEA